MDTDSALFLGFNLDAWITIATVLVMFSVLLFTKLRSDLVFLGAIGILFVTGVLDAKEAFSGFSNTSVLVFIRGGHSNRRVSPACSFTSRGDISRRLP